MIRAKSLFDSYNAGYVQQLFDQFLQNPGSISEHWRRIFESGLVAESGLLGAPAVAENGAASVTQLRAAMAAAALFDAHRLNGHWAAHLDPLGTPPPGHPMLEPSFYETSLEELASMPSSLLEVERGGETLADVLQWIRRTYSGPIGYEFEHLEDPRRREWVRARVESWEYRQPLSSEDQRRLLTRLSEVEAFEQFLHRSYLGQKRFSVEGTDMLVPMLDAAIEAAAADGAERVVLGMAHRGRLNVLTHVLGRPYEAIISEFEGRHAGYGTTGDVKYHLGATGSYTTISGKTLAVELVPNPSHLEFVNPVVEGVARARQTRVDGRTTVRDPQSTLPILIHGDAAFAGQGVVSETLNFALLEGYSTGGTLHIIVNNQVGFTTDPVA
ncbi:MAG TPA: thiamine pyrophosphate-dependent enzyme, partial [Longimicrobiales bacterium]|nr:thiamine pyrophosphate-dependent enzyme [Longimicrobiales bacterium]